MMNKPPQYLDVQIDEIKRAFATEEILRRDDLNAVEKIAYMKAISEVTNYMNSCNNYYLED